MRLCARSSYVNFIDEMEQALSPQRHLGQSELSAHRCPRCAGDSGVPAPIARVRRSSEDRGQTMQFFAGEGYNHFEIPETLSNPYGLLGRAVLAQMS